MRRARRVALTCAALVCAVGSIAACASTVDGSGSLGSRATSPSPTGSASGSPTGFPSTSASSSTAVGALSSYLISPPSGSEKGSSAWASTTTPTVQAFVQRFYDPDQVTQETARLQADGISGIAHVLWLYRGVQADVVLLQFKTSVGALTRHTGVVTVTRADTTVRAISVPGTGDITEFAASKVDKLGNISSRAYAVKNNVALEVFCFSPRTFDQKDLTTWTRQQVAKLP